VRGLGQEVRALAGVQALGALDAGGQQFLAARLELAGQFRDQLERLGASGSVRSRA
jgi:hypothetical protein